MLRSNFFQDRPVLLELRVENYAVIDHVVAEFAPGLNLLTGETGAGKSILIDALALLLGEKSSSDVIRHGADRAVVSGVFETESHAIDAALEANGIDSAGGEIILRREIATGGRGRVFVNNQPATVAVLKQLAPALASVHAQNESLLGFDAAARLDLLDTFAGCDTASIADAYSSWKGIAARIAELERGEQDRLRLLDLWQFQKKEIDAARPQPGEDERLESEKRVLANAEKIYAAAMGAYDLLYEGDASAASALRTAIRNVEELSRYDVRFQDCLTALDAARISAEDVSATLRDYSSGIDASPERLAEIEDRLATLDRLKRKYGRSLDDVIAYGEEVSRKLNDMENKDEVLRQLRSELAKAAESYLREARAVSTQRRQSAGELEKLVESEINDLAMKAKFRIEVTTSEAEPSAAGIDQVRYLISTNPGDPLRPLEQIASGGELSRVMLALKATVESAARQKRRRPELQRTLVFDEIDNGIGGRAAEAVGRKLKALAQTSQVLCITHLPQIACFADHHHYIEKKAVAGQTRTNIRRLCSDERRDELARMLSGAKVTDTSLKHAEQMLKTAAR